MARRIVAACGGVSLFGAPAAAGPDRAPQSYQPSAVWVWNENVITDSRAQAAFFAFAGTHGINRKLGP
jgi:hypothetical protein